MMKRILLAVLLLATACAAPAPTTDETLAAPVGTSTAMPVETATTAPGPTATILPVEAPMQPAFARYDLQPVNVSPSLRQEPVDPSFGNVLVPLVLSPEQLQRLVADGVIASPREHPEFHDLYRETQFANLPVFVTSDGLLHAYHLMFDATLLQLEEQVFLPHLQEFNQALLEQAEVQYQQLQGTAWEDSARRVAAFIAVGGKLADPAFPVPEYAAELVEAELPLINAAGGPQPSPIFPLLAFGEDYSQYLPRGHYAKTDSLKAYFKSMMWYGRMTFRLADPDETRMALLLSLAVRDGKAGGNSALELWQELYDPTAFLVGRSDDLTIPDYLGVMSSVYGPEADLTAIADDAKLETFIAAAGELPAPRILGLISADWKPLEAVKGLRLMGQRFVPDAYIFQNLIHPQVPGRLLPSGLDVMAVMGSDRAAGWLAQDSTTHAPEYAVKSSEMVSWLGGLSQSEWTETAYNGWLYTLRPLLTPPGEGYPLFMRSTAWQDKQLNTALGSWAELKHDTILYAKQAYGGLGGCGQPNPPSPVPAPAYVEPVPEVFARVAALATMTRVGLEQRGLLQLLAPNPEGGPTLSDRLDGLAAIALAFKTLAEKELAGTPLTPDEQDNLRGFGGYLEDLVQWANGEAAEPEPAAVIADVATDPNTQQVLEVGVGRVHEIYVVAPIPQDDGSLALTVVRGGIFSYYEFPSAQRLTDEAWRAQLAAGEAPAQPAFTSSFSVPQAAPLDIQQVIYRFQLDWRSILFYTVGSAGVEHDCGTIGPGYFGVSVSDEVRQQAQAAVDALRAQRQYEGRQWISTDYVSVEPASPDRITVTVRETWSDYLVTYEGENPFDWNLQGVPQPITARRGPYTVDVTYVLERVADPLSEYAWRVVSMTELTARPAWR